MTEAILPTHGFSIKDIGSDGVDRKITMTRFSDGSTGFSIESSADGVEVIKTHFRLSQIAMDMMNYAIDEAQHHMHLYPVNTESSEESS